MDILAGIVSSGLTVTVQTEGAAVEPQPHSMCRAPASASDSQQVLLEEKCRVVDAKDLEDDELPVEVVVEHEGLANPTSYPLRGLL